MGAGFGVSKKRGQAPPVTRYRYRGNTIPNPWTLPNHTITA